MMKDQQNIEEIAIKNKEVDFTIKSMASPMKNFYQNFIDLNLE